LTGGTFTHSLPIPVDEWLVAYGNRVYRPVERIGSRPEPLRPNQPWSPSDANVAQRELKGYLTGTKKTRVGESEILLEQEKYDPLHRDAVDIVRMLTFHEAAGGKSYTGLDNQQLFEHDLTQLLRLDRAVLFGKIEPSVTRLELDGVAVEPARQTAIVRIVLPVDRKESAQKLPKLSKENE
jgi:hypothetical protein